VGGRIPGEKRTQSTKTGSEGGGQGKMGNTIYQGQKVRAVEGVKGGEEKSWNNRKKTTNRSMRTGDKRMKKARKKIGANKYSVGTHSERISIQTRRLKGH